MLNELTTLLTMPRHLSLKDATSVREAFTRRLADIPSAIRLSHTHDLGKKMSQFKILAAELGLVFSCRSQNPWELGTCKSQNGRIRHYLPKGTDFSCYFLKSSPLTKK